MDDNENLFDGDNPIATLSHEQKIELTTDKYLKNVLAPKMLSRHAVRSCEFDIPFKNTINNN
jgi:hypothetical protein